MYGGSQHPSIDRIRCDMNAVWQCEWTSHRDPSHSLINVIDNSRKNLTSQKNYVYFGLGWCVCASHQNAQSHISVLPTSSQRASFRLCDFVRAWITSQVAHLFAQFFYTPFGFPFCKPYLLHKPIRCRHCRARAKTRISVHSLVYLLLLCGA